MVEEMNGQTVLSNFLRSVKIGQENALDIVKEILPDGKEKLTLAVQNRVLQPEQALPPQKAESPRRAHKFNSVSGFIAYVTKYKTADTVILANVESRRICCVLNDKSEKGFEVVSFEPQIHPLFLPWQEIIIGRKVFLTDFVRFLIANKKAIGTPDAATLTMLFSQVRASTQMTLHKGIGNRSLNGLTCQIEIMGKKDNQEVELPDSMQLWVPIFMDAERSYIDIDLLLDAKEGAILVSCSSSDVEVRKVEAFEGFVKQLQAIPDVIVSLGSVHTEEWRYIQERSR